MDAERRNEIWKQFDDAYWGTKCHSGGYGDFLIDLIEKAVREEILFTCECEGCKRIDVKKAAAEEIFKVLTDGNEFRHDVDIAKEKKKFGVD